MFGTEPSTSTADRSLLLAARAWGGLEVEKVLDKLAPAWRDALRDDRARASRIPARAALERLRGNHEASARPDLGRVHSSWLVRALQAESPAVREVIAALAPPGVREKLVEGGVTDLPDPAPGGDRRGDPEAVAWALTLWTERLVGDVPDRPEDPPVVVAITRLRARELARMIKVCGQVKHAFAIDGHGPSAADEAIVRMSVPDRVRIAFFRRRIGSADRRLVPAARRDLAAIGEERRRGHSRLGLLTFGRLLDSAEPHRARWALQHLPYPVARLMRQKSDPPLSPRAMAAWESWVLESAWARLLAEGRLSGARGVRP